MLGKPGLREEPAARRARSDVARLAPWLCRRKVETSCGRTGRRPWPSSPQGSDEPGFGCPHVVTLQKSVGGIGSRIRSSNALQKERQGRVNRDLARGTRLRVEPGPGPAGEKSVAGRAPSLVTRGTYGTQAQGDGRSSSSGRVGIVRCRGGRGTGDTKSTGTYEGSLPMEGILDRNEARPFTRSSKTAVLAYPAPSDPSDPSREGSSANTQLPRRRERRRVNGVW